MAQEKPAKRTSRSDLTPEGRPVADMGGRDPEEMVYVKMKKYHHHGPCGVLEKDEVYEIPWKHATQIDRDFEDTLVFLKDQKEAQEIVRKRQEAQEKENKKALDKQKKIQAREKRRAKTAIDAKREEATGRTDETLLTE